MRIIDLPVHSRGRRLGRNAKRRFGARHLNQLQGIFHKPRGEGTRDPLLDSKTVTHARGAKVGDPHGENIVRGRGSKQLCLAIVRSVLLPAVYSGT